MIVTPILLALVAQQRVLSVNYFNGGGLGAYLSHLKGTRELPEYPAVVQELGPAAFGANRVVKMEDGALIADQPLAKYFKYFKQKSTSYLHLTFLPRPYLFSAPLEMNSKPDDGLDRIDEDRIVRTAQTLPGFRGSLAVANQFSALHRTVHVHPFFKPMRVALRWSGAPPAGFYESIGKAIGAIWIESRAPDVPDKVVPNYLEIRTRALATCDYFYPSISPKPFQIREQTQRWLIESLPDPEFQRWVDACEKPFRQPLGKDKIGLRVRQYIKAYLDFLEEIGSSRFKTNSREEIESCPTYVEFGGYLQFKVVVVLPNGIEYLF